MEVIFVLVLLFVYFPAVFGVVANVAGMQGNTAGSIFSYIFKAVKYSSIDGRYVISIIIFLVFMCPIFVYKKFIGPSSGLASLIALVLMVFMMVVSTVAIYSSPLIRNFYRRFFYGINLIVAAFAAINLSRATSYAEGIVSSLVGVRASELPTGLTWISILMVPVAWAITISMWSMAIHVVTLIYTIYNEVREERRRGVHISQCSSAKSSSKIPNGLLLTLGFVVLTVSPVSIASFLLKSSGAERFVREELVDASFHISPEECGIKEALGARIAYLELGKAVIAIPDKKLGFQFRPVECVKNWNKPADVEKLIASINSEFDKAKHPDSSVSR